MKATIIKNKNTSKVSSDETKFEMMRTFSTALLSTRVEPVENYTTELEKLFNSPAFAVIFDSIANYAESQNTSLDEAASTIIKTFRDVDTLWKNYLIQEGISKLKEQMK